MKFTHIEPTIPLFDRKTHLTTELFAREGDTVHIYVERHGANRVSLESAKSMVREGGVTLTAKQASILEMEVSNG